MRLLLAILVLASSLAGCSGGSSAENAPPANPERKAERARIEGAPPAAVR